MFFSQNKKVKQKAWFFHAVFLSPVLLFFFQCQSISEKKFYLLRKIDLPSAGRDAAGIMQRKELRYLLYRNDDPENRGAVEKALGGDWNEAAPVWEKKAEIDCLYANNLGQALEQTGSSRSALAAMSRALALCPDNEKIRANYNSGLLTETKKPRFDMQ